MRRVALVIATSVVAACSGRGRVLAPIRLEPVVAFGAENGDGAIATDPRVSAHHPRGFRIVIPSAAGVAVLPLVYGDDGRFLGDLRGGRSAAEQFRTPLFARIGPADSIWVFDGAHRVLIFNPDRHYVRTAPLPVSPWDALVLPDSRMLIAPSDADRPLPLLLLGATGVGIRDFGAVDSDVSLHAARWLVRDRDGSFWSMPAQFQWRLEHWDTGGALVSVLERRPDWFKPYTHVSAPGPDHAPQPTIQGAWIDSVGRLWVLGMIADPGWRLGIDWHRQQSSGAVIGDADKVYDTILEVLDLRTRRLIATQRIRQSYPSEVEPGVLLHIRETTGGWKKVEVVKVIFRGNAVRAP
ncbi:MAG: hypothetical protein ACRELE_01125 [Gemmatimonadales bacterium]